MRKNALNLHPSSEGQYSTFRQWQKDHPNIMTPHIISITRKGSNKFIELSEGTGFSGENIYGVSVIDKTPEGYHTRSDVKLNRMFYSMHEAKEHVVMLKRSL